MALVEKLNHIGNEDISCAHNHKPDFTQRPPRLHGKRINIQLMGSSLTIESISAVPDSGDTLIFLLVKLCVAVLADCAVVTQFGPMALASKEF